MQDTIAEYGEAAVQDNERDGAVGYPLGPGGAAVFEHGGLRDERYAETDEDEAEGTAHIACDPNSRSEIVVPVFGPDGALIAVFDVDSSLEGSFDAIDQTYLERLLREQFRERPWTDGYALSPARLA